MRASGWATCLLLAASCADAPPPDVHTGPPEAPEIAKAPEIVESPAPVLPPLARDARDPCDVARSRRARAADFLAKGRAMRALGELAAADRLCAADADQGANTKKAARDMASPASNKSMAGALLVANARSAKARGDVSGARKLFDQALARLEQETSTTPSVVWGRDAGTALALSADGATAVLALGTTAVLVDAAHLTPLRFFDHPPGVVAAVLSRDGKLLATVDRTGDAFLWDTATGKKLHRYAWSGEPAELAALTPDGKELVVVGAPAFNSSVRIWSTETGDSVASFLIEGTDRPTSLAISPDGKLAAFGGQRGHVELWSLAPKLKKAFVLADKQSFLESSQGLVFSPKGDRIAATFENGSVGVWDTAGGKQVWVTSSSEPFLTLGACVFSPDGKRLLATWEQSSSPSVRVWDAGTGAELQNAPASGRVVAFSEDAKRGLVEGENSSSVGLLDVSAMTPLGTRSTSRSRIESLLFGPPRVVAVGFRDDDGLRVLLPTGLRALPIGESPMVVPSFDGKEVAVAVHSQLTLWDIESGRPRESLGEIGFYPDTIALGADRTVRVSESFQKLLIVSTDARRTGWKTRFTEPRGEGSFPKLLLSGFSENALLIRDNGVTVVETGSGRTQSIQHGLPRWSSVDMSPDGRVVFIVGGDALHRFDARTGARIGAPVPFDCFSHATAMSFDGSRIALLCETNARVLTFGDRDDVTSTVIALGEQPHRAVLSPHGDLLVAARSDGRLQFWRVADGHLLGDARFLPNQDAALVEGAEGRVELLGEKASELEQELWCRLGAEAYPFDLCSDALLEDGLVGELFAPR